MIQVEFALLVAATSIFVAIYFNQKTAVRNKKIDDQAAAASMATMETQLKHICLGIEEIRYDLRSIKDDLKESRERLVRVEAVAASAHKRIDKIEERVVNKA